MMLLSMLQQRADGVRAAAHVPPHPTSAAFFPPLVIEAMERSEAADDVFRMLALPQPSPRVPIEEQPPPSALAPAQPTISGFISVQHHSHMR